MLDEKDLQAIAQLITAMEVRLDQKLAQQKQEILDEATHRMKVLLDAEVSTKFNLLAEELRTIRDLLPHPETLEAMQEDLDLHHAMLKKHTRELQDLKKAQ